VQFPDPEPTGQPPLEAQLAREVGLTSDEWLTSDAELTGKVELSSEAGLASEIGLDPLSLFDDLLQQLAAAAELCLKPQRYGARYIDQPVAGSFDCCVQLEARDQAGERQGAADLELEIYRSGSSLNLMLSRPVQPLAPLLWHGQHPVWMDANSGERCERPPDGAPLEALARRVRALL
jgi:hypothetical protein